MGFDYILYRENYVKLSSRFGLKNQSPVLGIGIEYHKLILDYAYKVAPESFIDNSHLISMTYKFSRKRQTDRAKRIKPKNVIFNHITMNNTNKQDLKHFSDLNGHWIKPTAEKLNVLNLIDFGKIFSPNKKVSRGEYASILVKMFDIPKLKTDTLYTDVSPDATNKIEIDSIVSKGILSKDAKNNFFPDKTLTRLEAIITIIRISNLPIDLNVESFPFNDIPKGHWARPYLESALYHNILPYTNEFDPNEKISRAEIIWLLSKVPQVDYKLIEFDQVNR